MTNPQGYSGTPLPKKLGFKPGFVVGVVDAPDNYGDLLSGAEDVTFVHVLDRGDAGLDAVHAFLQGPLAIADTAQRAIDTLKPGGMLWLSWAKKSSPLYAGVTEDDLRANVLPLGWVDVKVCAIDADWSGLKFLKRKPGKASDARSF